MDPQLVNIPTEIEWDELRSRDLCYDRVKGFPQSFVQDVFCKIYPSVRLLDVDGLASYMLSRGLVGDNQHGRLTARQYTKQEKTQELQRVLMYAKYEKCPHQFVKSLYLALCDLYEDDGQRSHYLVAQSLRESALLSLECGTYDRNMKELTCVLENVPSVPLNEQQAHQVRHNLGLCASVGEGNLQEITIEWHKQSHNPSPIDMVRALMITPGLGRYVSGLMPYCFSNCHGVRAYIAQLMEEWEILAEYMGYAHEEIQKIQRSSATKKEFCVFLRVWRMPNCDGKDVTILEETMKSARQLLPQRMKNRRDMAAVHRDDSTNGAAKHPIQVNVALYVGVQQHLPGNDAIPTVHQRNIQESSHLPLLPGGDGFNTQVSHGTDVPASTQSDTWAGQEYNAGPEGAWSHVSQSGSGVLEVASYLPSSQTSEVYSPLPEASGGRQSPSEHVSSHAVMSKKDIAPVYVYGCCCGKVAQDHNIWRADVNTRDKNGMTGLMHACVNKHTQCVSSLLELDAHVDLQDQDGMTALMHACERRASECVELLLDHRADTGPIDKYGHTCLHNKEVLTCPPVLGLLLKRTKDVDPVNMYGRTPLCEAIILCSDEAVKLLLQHGARQVTRDPKNSTSMLELALRLKVSPEKEEAKKRIVELLMLSLEGRLLQ